MFSDNIDELIEMRSIALKRFGYKSITWRRINQRIQNLRARGERLSSNIRDAREKLFPLFAMLIKEKRGQMKDTIEEEVTRAVECFSKNDCGQMDLAELEKITREKVKAEYEQQTD